MDRALIIIVLLVFLLVSIVRNKDVLTYPKLAEILVAFYIFSCCFSRFGLPLYTLGYPQQYGAFGLSVRLEVYQVLVLFFLWLIARQHAWKFPKIQLRIILIAIIYLFYCALNPFNTVKSCSFIALNYIFSYLIFLYLLTTCFSVKTIVTGIYYGFAVTVGLHAVLAVCFPLLGMGFMATIFNHHASIREASRCGSPGTFGHPNVLGTYASYYMMFFVSCAMAKYKMKESIMFSALAIFVIFLSGSRSALLAVFFGVLMLVVFYVLRRYSVLNPKIFLWGVVPTVVIIGLLFFFTPLSDMFSDTSNLDEMSTARLMHYYCATEIIKAHPWLGVGLNSHLKFLLADKTIDINAVFGAEYWMPEDFMFTNPIHNVWLSLLAELGIVGFTPIVVYVVNFFRTFKKKIKNSQSIFYTISVMTALGIISCLLVQGNSDWAPETPQVLNITILFLFLAGTTSYAGETEEIAASPDYLKL